MFQYNRGLVLERESRIAADCPQGGNSAQPSLAIRNQSSSDTTSISRYYRSTNLHAAIVAWYKNRTAVSRFLAVASPSTLHQQALQLLAFRQRVVHSTLFKLSSCE